MPDDDTEPIDALALDAHLSAMQAPRPGKRWRARTLELLDDPGVRADVIETVRGYTTRPPDSSMHLVRDRSARGHLWAAALAGDPGTLGDLDTIVRRAGCLTGENLWDQSLANAAISALGAFDDPAAVGVLRALEKELGYPGARKQIELALRSAAARDGLSPEQLAEREVPTHDLGRSGSITHEVDGYQVVLEIADPRTVRLTFTDPGGNVRRTRPAALKDGPAEDEIKDLRSLAAQVRRTLAEERARLELLLTTARTLPYADWRRYYLDHPITGVITRGLIWEFENGDGAWQAATPADGVPVTVGGDALTPPGEDGRVRLWHPIRATTPQINAWRAFVHENAMVQPFKQAFREIYLLTPAEEETRLYSNRFAAHIVRYRQLYALMKERGWKATFLRGSDAAGEGRKILRGEWRVRFYHEAAEDDYEWSPEHAATDQVRFERRRGGRWAEVPLADVPPVVFSEAMRDVDLFVGVTSIAADPEWSDRGEDRYVDYWRQTTFGGLTASAEVRRDALARILPRTRIAGRCELAGRFLVVRGDLRTYKIHLGSANILMEPDDSYLCIVRSRGGESGKVFLPFEDERLSLILSKAFLLAADTKITDETIVRQLGAAR